ncbi:MAG: tRNA-(ms[2]io[6]A)-hydroxylase [Pseudomonadota bacterium]|nr:tRNA-(ms[2]io[6]A)-hydroxylase [Pseudomonadota bacterium]
MNIIIADLTIERFLRVPTPEAWLQAALQNQELMLIDHAHCEKKAASTAISMIYRYPDRIQLLQKMSRLAREELRHFEHVLRFIERRGFTYRYLTPSRYAEGLMKHVRTTEPAKLIDTLIVGAFIEARSCERFAKIAPLLDIELGEFYNGLLASESRHFQDYLKLAELYNQGTAEERIHQFARFEAELITEPDEEFRFHSGVPTI